MRTMPTWRISFQTWLSLLALGLVLLVVVQAATLLIDIFWILFGAFLLSLAMRPMADFLERRLRVPRWLSVVFAYLAILALLALLGTLLVPVIRAQMEQLRSNGPDLLQAALTRLAQLPGIGPQLPSLGDLAQHLAQRLDTVALTTANALSRLGTLAVELIVVFILAFFFTTDRSLGVRLLETWVPPRHRPRIHRIVNGMSYRMRRWVWAQLGAALFFAVVFGTGLGLLGVPFALTIAVVGGTLEVIPFVGSVTALVLGLLSALTVSPWLALAVLVLHQIVLLVENNLVIPYFFGQAVGVHAALVLVALVIGAKAAGVIGVLFAIPLTVLLLTVLEEVRITYINPGQPSDGKPAPALPPGSDPEVPSEEQPPSRAENTP